jgi:hypothetical protein
MARRTKGHPLFKLRQIWVPNQAHLEMLHFVAYSYNRTKFGSATRVELLQSLSRACGWLFREAQRPGQMVTMVATAVLSEAYTYPSDDIRQGQLGFLLAWLNAKGGRRVRMAAAEEVERQSISTNLDPPFERDELEPDVEAFNEARKDDDRPRLERSERRIRKMLTDELLRRWRLTEDAVRAIQSDKDARTGAAEAIAASLDDITGSICGLSASLRTRKTVRRSSRRLKRSASCGGGLALLRRAVVRRVA